MTPQANNQFGFVSLFTSVNEMHRKEQELQDTVRIYDLIADSFVPTMVEIR